jgi:tetratricopeptide (TPR) repeat protein
MSPEQVSGDISALDTRSDVYALGVILYEVLAERPPYELDRQSFAEAARIISDEEPAPWSSAARPVPAEVETIVAKALEKEKERRYNSAAELADDIRRFLRHEPITARPPTTAYQVRKFARRHKAIVGGVLACIIVLLIGVVATSWQAVRALRAERVAAARAREAELAAAKAAAVTSFLTQMLASVDPSRAQGRDVSVREALDAAAARIDAGAMGNEPGVEIAVRDVIGTTYGSLGLFEAAERQLRASLALQPLPGSDRLGRAETDARLVDVLYSLGKYAEAETVAQEAFTLRREALGPQHADVASSLDDLGSMIMVQGDIGRAEPLMREALAIRRAVLPPNDPQIAVGLNNLAYLLWRKGELDEGESMYREALGIDRHTLGDSHPEIPTRLLNLAVLLRDRGRPGAAEPLAAEALDIRRRVLGVEHPDVANAMDTLAATLEDQGETARAEELLRDALALARRTYGEVNLNTARLQHNLGWVLWKRGAYSEAQPFLDAAVVNIPKTYGAAYRGNRLAIASRAHNLNSLGDARGAEAAARQSLAMYREAPTDYVVTSALVALSHALINQRRPAEAVPLLREALDVVQAHPLVRFPWLKGEAQSTLGAVLAVPGNAAEAETLLLAGHEGLSEVPSAPLPRRRAALERLVSFYAVTGRAAEASSWRSRLRAIDQAGDGAKATATRPRG